MSNAPDLGGYKEVKDRIVEFREKHPDGSLQPLNHEQPYALEFVKVGNDELCFVVYAAACYRTPDDTRPGIGVAWEPFPGRTPYTRNSELMNAETSAWGRAIVAALAADASAIATKEDVEKRRAEDGTEAVKASPRATEKAVKAIWAKSKAVGWDHDTLIANLVKRFGENAHPDTLTKEQASAVLDGLTKLEAAHKEQSVIDDLGAEEVDR